MNKYTFTCSKRASFLPQLLQQSLFAFLFLLSSFGVWGQTTGIYESYAILNINGGGNTYYDLNAATANADFNNASLGTFLSGTNTLVFAGGENKTFKCNGGNVTGSNIYYRVYLSSGSGGAFTGIGMSFVSNDAGGCGGNQTWRVTNGSTNIIAGLAAGTYTLEVYSDAPGFPSTAFASNNGANYRATFTVLNQLYSKSTGNLETLSSWGTNTDGTGTAPANFSTGGITYNIRNRASATIGANWTVSGTGSKIIVGDGTNPCTFTIPSGFTYSSTATDISASAILRNQNTAVTTLGTCSVTGTYEHNANGGTIPTATWQTNSTCNVTGSTGTTDLSGLGQSFFNFTYNCSGGVELINTGAFNVTNTFSMPSTNAGTIRMGNASTSYSISIKDFSLAGGTFNLAGPQSSGGAIQTLAITGALSMTGGTLDLSASSTGTGTLTVAGNFTHSGGTIQKTNGTGSITLNGTIGTQTLESTGQTNIAGSAIAFSVAGSNAQCVVAATKTFTLSSGSTFQIANGSSNPDLSISGTFINISAVTNGFGNAYASSGNISLNNGGTYVHNTIRSVADYLAIATNNSGSTVIYRGSSTLQPSISLSGRTYHHLTIESTSGSLSLTGTGTSSFIVNGNLTIGANCTFGPNVTSTPGHSIKGNISIGSGGILNYSPSGAGTINLNGSGTQIISGAGTFTTGANATLAVGASSTIDFGTTNAIAGLGTFTTASGSTLITANTSGINGSLTLTNKTLNAGTNYIFNGTSAQVTGAAVTAANNLTVNNSNGLTLSANTSATGTLTLTNGKLTTNGNTLTLSNAVSGADANKYIVADATGTATFNGVTTARIFPLGTSAVYAPLTVIAGSATNYTAYVTSSLPCSATDNTKMVNLAWGLSGTNTPSQVVFQWPAGSQAGAFVPGSSCDLGRFNAACPYNVSTIGAASGSGPYTLTCASGLGSTNNIYVIGNENAVYIAAPTVATTLAPTSITNNAAASGGQTITGINITEKGVVWNTSTAPTVALTTKTNDGTGTGNFTSALSSLNPETLYYIRAYATNASGTGYGDEKSFRTLSNPATAQATSLTASASSSSNIDLSWNAATFPSSGATAKGYVLLRATAPNTPVLTNSNGSAPTVGVNTTIVSSVISESATAFSNSGLVSSTQYNYLLVPYTWDGTNATTYNYLTASAPTASATTTSGATPPILTTSTVSSVTAVSATLNGDITSDGGGSVTARGFVYSSSDNTPTLGEAGVTDQTSGSGIGTFDASVSALTPNTTYFYQAYATNLSGTSYGGVVSFTTPKAEPTAQPTSLVFSSITTSAFSTAFTAATGSPDGYLVIRSTSSSLSADPLDGTTYTAGNTLGGGTIVSVGSTISGISNTGLSSGTTYYTFIFAFNNSGTTIDYLTSSPLSGSTITLTDAPAILTLSSVTTSGFTVDWTATVGAISYRLDVSAASNFASFVSGYQDLTVNGTSQVVTGLAANTLYYVRVRAVNPSGTSANSGTANSATLPNAPTVGNATSITTSGLTANWTAPSGQGGASFTYTIELSTANDFSTITSSVSNIASGTTSNAFTGLSEGTTYFYRVRAVNSAGNGAWSTVSAGATTLMSAVSLTALGTNFTQDFNTLATSGNSSSLPSGWYLSESGSGANSTLSANDGSSSTGDTYSYGTSTNSDRALGALLSGSVVPTIGAKFQNNTGSVINNLSISYIGEQWRLGATGRNDRLDFQYSLDATSISSAGTWTDVNSLDLSGPISSGSTGALNGNNSSNRTEITHIITGLTIADGAFFYIRWSDFNASGADDGLAVDDFSIKPCGTVSAPTASNQAFCSAATSTVANLTATGTAVQWYAASTGGTALASPTALNSTTYYASQTISGCESVSRTPVVVTVNTNPSAPTGGAIQNHCSGSTVANLSATGTAIQWYAAPTGGSPLATNTAIVNGTTYYASQTTNSCESTTRLAVTPTIVNSGSWIGAASSDWSDAANWCGGVPTGSTNVTVLSGTNFPLVITSAVSINSMTINAGATVSTTGTPTITIANNGSFTNNGTFTAGTSKVSFTGAGTVSGTVGFNDVDLAGGVNFGSASTINGTLTINPNGWVNTNAPSYGPTSKLRYNSGGTYGRGFEWGTTSGAGYPNDVQISNNTTLNYPNSAGNFTATIGVARDVTIDAGSKLFMDFGAGSASGTLIIGRHINIAGDLSLGDAVGGDIYLGGDWTRTSGNFNANGRAVFFTGTTGNQTITNSAGESFPFVIVDKSSGNVILNNNVTITGGLTLTNGLVDIGSNNLDLLSSTLSGGSPTNYVRTSGTGECRRNLPVGATVLFPVGRLTYNPVELVKSGSQHKFGVRVLDVVTANGQDNGPVSTGPNVGRMWDITPEAGYTASNGAVSVNLIYANNLGHFMNGFVNSSPADRRMFHFGPAWVDITDLTGQFVSGNYSIANYNFCRQPGITDFSPFTITNFGAALPIELVSFQANCKEDNSVAVSWTTASENNTSHYVVEKSNDGSNWSVLGQTVAAGNSTQLLTYEMIDSEKSSGTTYYRLTQFDNDGMFEVFDPVSINCNAATSNNHITTYPNPSSESFYVSLFTETMKGNGQLTITDASGRPVYGKSVNIQDGNNVFHIGDLNAAPGMYYIQVSNGTITTHIVKHSLR